MLYSQAGAQKQARAGEHHPGRCFAWAGKSVPDSKREKTHAEFNAKYKKEKQTDYWKDLHEAKAVYGSLREV